MSNYKRYPYTPFVVTRRSVAGRTLYYPQLDGQKRAMKTALYQVNKSISERIKSHLSTLCVTFYVETPEGTVVEKPPGNPPIIRWKQLEENLHGTIYELFEDQKHYEEKLDSLKSLRREAEYIRKKTFDAMRDLSMKAEVYKPRDDLWQRVH